MSLNLPQGMQINAPLQPGYENILTLEALEFVAKLHRAFEPRRQELLKARVERQARIEQLEARIAELESEEITNIQRLPRNAVRPSIDDIWGEEEHPTMVDLAKLNLDELPDLRMRA